MDDTAGRSRSGTGASGGGDLKRRVIIGAIVVASSFVLWLLATSVVPRWWAQRVGNLVDGRLTAGTVFGLSTGFVFSVLPLVTVALGWKFRDGWRRFGLFLLAAFLLAGPNLATLGIVVGNGKAAHAGERILDVDGPGFRSGTFFGSLIGVIVVVGAIFLVRSRGKNRAKAKKLKAELEGS